MGPDAAGAPPPTAAFPRAVAAVDRVSDVAGRGSAWLIAPLVLGVCYEVFARYLFNAPTAWAYHLAYMLYAALALLGAASTLRRGAHIRTDFLYAALRPRARAAIDVVGYALLLPVLAFYTWVLFDVALHAWGIREPLHRLKGVIVVAFVLLSLQAMAELLRRVPALRRRPLP